MDKREYIIPSVEMVELQSGSHICEGSLGNEDIKPGDHTIIWGY